MLAAAADLMSELPTLRRQIAVTMYLITLLAALGHTAAARDKVYPGNDQTTGNGTAADPNSGANDTVNDQLYQTSLAVSETDMCR